MNFVIRSAEPQDIAVILRLIRALAEYERLLDHAVIDEERITQTFFVEHPKAYCDIAEVLGEAVGYAIWFYSYSTFTGRHGIYLEDLYVAPEHRGSGIGKAFLENLAERCVREKLTRFEWSVLDWNEPSIGFYRSLGAVPVDGWIRYRLDGQALARIGAENR